MNLGTSVAYPVGPNFTQGSSGADSSGFRLRLFAISVWLCLVAGLIFRLVQAWRYFLNPDEALHYLLANQSSLGIAYRAALTNAHPPLFILVLYYWRVLGHSELWLRMPSVLAGTAACWFVYQWLKLATDRETARTGLILFALAPSLIGLSGEIRQYALLLFFMTACLYLAELALVRNSVWLIGVFSISLWGALLVHYSALLFALTMGVYMLVRLYPYTTRLRLCATWAAGQIAGIALIGYFLLFHVTRLRASGMVRGDAEGYLRKSLFHPSEQHALVFVGTQTLRLFTYLFSHGFVGSVALVVFIAGIWLLLRRRTADHGGPTPRQLSLLLLFPFVANCVVGLAGIYPYGGSRHCIVLAPFAVAGISIAVASLRLARARAGSVALIAVLVFCNLFPAPPPMIRPRNQLRSLMAAAVDSFQHSAPPGSTVLADYQSSLLFGYYACAHAVVPVFPPFQPFAKADCTPYTVISSSPAQWKFYAADFPGDLSKAAEIYGLAPGSRVWVFNAGWINDSAPALGGVFRQLGCSAPQSYGENIQICDVKVAEVLHSPQ
jgi:hypothetical protein